MCLCIHDPVESGILVTEGTRAFVSDIDGLVSTTGPEKKNPVQLLIEFKCKFLSCAVLEINRSELYPCICLSSILTQYILAYNFFALTCNYTPKFVLLGSRKSLMLRLLLRKLVLYLSSQNQLLGKLSCPMQKLKLFLRVTLYLSVLP